LSLPGTPLLASLVGEEAGMRAQAGRDLAFTVAFYNLDQQSETIIDPDVGTDAAGPASRRSGYEINATYNINRWLEFYGSYSGDHTRFRQEFDDGTGHLGNHITDAPLATGSLALYVKNLGHWSGGLEYRYLGNYPLSSGPCADSAVAHDFPNSFPNTSTPPTCANAIAQGLTSGNQVDGKGFGELNADVRYQFMDGFSMALGVYNLLDTKRNAAEFIYVDRLKSEVTATNADGSPEYPDGRADVHIHPLETIAARLTLTKTFGGY
jgi:outer membrane receptor protein involved in Fe transport